MGFGGHLAIHGAILGYLERLGLAWVADGADWRVSWGPLGALLKLSWAVLGPLGAILFGAILGASWRPLGDILAGLKCIWRRSETMHFP